MLPMHEVLYHGTIFNIEKIDVACGRNNKDCELAGSLDKLYAFITHE